MKTIARWVVLGTLFIIPFLSLYVANGSYFPFITGKNFAFRILVEIAFGGWIVLALADRKYRPKFSWPLVSYGLLVLWMVIANSLALNAHKAFWSNFERMDGWMMLVHVFIFFVVASAVLSADGLWRRWWLAFIGVSAVVSLYGAGQMLGMFAIHQSADRIDATLGNAEYLAGYLIFAIAVTLWQAFETRTRDMSWLRYALFVLAGLQLVVLFATGTRGTLIGLIGAGFVGAVLWMLEAGKRGRQGAAAVFILLVLIVGGLFVARDSSFVHNSPNLDRLASTFSLKQALGTRITIWHMAVQGIEQRPVTGWGQEGYNYIFNQYYEPSLYGQEPWFDRAHDVFLDWGVAGGIPALLLFIALLLASAYSIYRAPVSRAERILLLSALAGYSIQGLVVFDNLFTYIPFAAIIGIAHMLRSKPIAAFEKWPALESSMLNAVAAPAALVIACGLVWFVNVPSIQASSDLIGALTPSNSVATRFSYFKKAVDDHSFAHQEIAEQLVQFAAQEAADTSISDTMRQDIAAYSVEQIAQEVTRAPQDARLRLQYALLLRSVGDIKDAQVQSAAAHTLSPNKQSILLEEGVEALQLKDPKAAEEFFTQAYQLDTHYTDPAAFVAASRILAGNVAGGKAMLQQAYGTTTVTQQILVLAYYQAKDWNDLIAIVAAQYAKDHASNSGFQLAAAYAQAGRIEEARATVRSVMQEHPEAAAQGTALLAQLGVAK